MLINVLFFYSPRNDGKLMLSPLFCHLVTTETTTHLSKVVLVVVVVNFFISVDESFHDNIDNRDNTEQRM